MFQALKNFIGEKKSSESGFRKLCEEDGVDFRELTVQEMEDVDFENFAVKLSRAGVFPSGYCYTPSCVDIVALDKNSDKVNYVNVVYCSEESDDILKVNIKNFNVSTAKNDSLVYQYNKRMSKVWLDSCYAILWARQFLKNGNYANGNADKTLESELVE